jgi:hypothetical protein
MSAAAAEAGPGGYDIGDLVPCQVAEVRLSGVEVFKCVGDEPSIAAFLDRRPPRVVGDWSALYLQFDIAHALGNVGYRWDAGYARARLFRGQLSAELPVLVLDAPWMPDPSIPGDIKARDVRRILGLEEDVL